VDNYEDGRIVDHDGSWRAGERGALPGILMPASPAVGAEFEQERAPGIAEDRSTVLETGLTVTVPAGTFSNCIKTEDVNPLDDAVENKWYCADVGLVKEQGEDEVLELVSVTLPTEPGGPTGTTAPTAPPATATAARAGAIGAPSTGGGPDGPASDRLALWAAAAAAAGALALAAGTAMARRWRSR
jgi:hypothetical protein